MTLAHPWALVALITLPVLWWLHRRRRRPLTFDVPSLMFLEDERTVRPARRRTFDLELAVTLLAAGLLALAAAGPTRPVTGSGRTIRAVVSGGTPADATGYRARIQGKLNRLRALLGPFDRLQVVEEPPGAGDGLRPTPGALVDAAQAGDAAFRVVLSDHPPPTGGTPGVTWMAVGSPDARNAGIVAATLEPEGTGFVLFANVQGSGLRPQRVVLEATYGEGEGERVALDLPAGVALVSHAFVVPRIGLTATLALASPAGDASLDDLAADDRVVWQRRPLRVRWSPELSPAHRQAVERGLRAALGRGAFGEAERQPDLVVGLRGSPEPTWTLVLHPVAEGASESRAPSGMDRVRPDPLVADLSTGGVDLRYAAGADVAPRDSLVLLARVAGGREWPVVARQGRTVHFLPDPLRGRPSPARAALWPLFLEDWLRHASGIRDRASWGFRRRGLLDAESSRLGNEAPSSELPPLASLPPDRPAEAVTHAPLLTLLALGALAIVWFVPWERIRRRRAPRSVPRTVPSTG